MNLIEGLEELPSLFGAAAGTSAALAQPPSRPRRVPGGLVAGDWELSPGEPRVGPAREGEALAAVSRPLGQRPPRRPSWALGPVALWPEPGPTSGRLGTRRFGEKRTEQRVPSPTALPWKEAGARLKSRLRRQKEAEGNHLGAGVIAVNYLDNDFSLDFPLWSWAFLKDAWGCLRLPPLVCVAGSECRGNKNGGDAMGGKDGWLPR